MFNIFNVYSGDAGKPAMELAQLMINGEMEKVTPEDFVILLKATNAQKPEESRLPLAEDLGFFLMLFTVATVSTPALDLESYFAHAKYILENGCNIDWKDGSNTTILAFLLDREVQISNHSVYNPYNSRFKIAHFFIKNGAKYVTSDYKNTVFVKQLESNGEPCKKMVNYFEELDAQRKTA